MMKVKYYKCPIDSMKFKTLGGWGDHMKKKHSDSIPPGYSISRYFYMTVTGRTHGTCRVCKSDTEWNEKSMKYSQFCPNPKCKEEYAKTAKARMVNKYGKVHLLNDPEMQRKMMSNRRISGEYRFKDGCKIPYVAKYEHNFLKMMDTFLGWPSTDIMGPSPNNYEYEYKNKNDLPENEGMKIYIPDFYIPTLNLEIEIKQTQTTHPKFIAIDQVKEKLKDIVMENNPKINYIKLVDNDYSNFFNYLLSLKENYTIDNKEEIIKGTRSTEGYVSLSEIDYDIAIESSVEDIADEPKVIKPSEFDDYIKVQKYFRGGKLTALKNIEKGTIIRKKVAHGPKDGKLRDMNITMLAMYIDMKKSGNTMLKKHVDSNSESYDIVAIRNIKKGDILSYNVMPEFYNENRI